MIWLCYDVLNLFQGEVKGAKEEEAMVLAQDRMIYLGMIVYNLRTMVMDQ